MSFDPAAFAKVAEEERAPLEEISSSDIAHHTLKAVCREVAGAPEECEQLWTDIQHLYDVADSIERETLGRSTGQQGRQLVNDLAEQQGKKLFEMLLEEAKGNTQGGHNA